jgi:hypothetical protein
MDAQSHVAGHESAITRWIISSGAIKFFGGSSDPVAFSAEPWWWIERSYRRERALEPLDLNTGKLTGRALGEA